MMGELGELAGTLEKWLWYNQKLDEPNLKEELGDLLWYVAEMANVLELSLEDVMAVNISKLKARYPERYSDELAKEENRDRIEEAKILRAIDTNYDPDQAV